MLRHVHAERLCGELLDDLARPVDAAAIVPALAGRELERSVPGLDAASEVIVVAPDVLGPAGEVRVSMAVAEAGGVSE